MKHIYRVTFPCTETRICNPLFVSAYSEKQARYAASKHPRFKKVLGKYGNFDSLKVYQLKDGEKPIYLDIDKFYDGEEYWPIVEAEVIDYSIILNNKNSQSYQKEQYDCDKTIYRCDVIIGDAHYCYPAKPMFVEAVSEEQAKLIACKKGPSEFENHYNNIQVRKALYKENESIRDIWSIGGRGSYITIGITKL